MASAASSVLVGLLPLKSSHDYHFGYSDILPTVKFSLIEKWTLVLFTDRQAFSHRKLDIGSLPCVAVAVAVAVDGGGAAANVAAVIVAVYFCHFSLAFVAAARRDSGLVTRHSWAAGSVG